MSHGFVICHIRFMVRTIFIFIFFSSSKVERGASSPRASVVTVIKSYDSSVIYVFFFLFADTKKLNNHDGWGLKCFFFFRISF